MITTNVLGDASCPTVVDSKSAAKFIVWIKRYINDPEERKVKLDEEITGLEYCVLKYIYEMRLDRTILVGLERLRQERRL